MVVVETLRQKEERLEFKVAETAVKYEWNLVFVLYYKSFKYIRKQGGVRRINLEVKAGHDYVNKTPTEDDVI